MNLLEDYVFKNFVKNPNSRWFIEELTALILQIKKEYVKNNLIIYDSEMYKYKKKEKGHIADLIVGIDNYIINYEANNEKYKTIIEDKVRYLNHLYNISFPINAKVPSKKIIQVHINNFEEKETSNVLIRKNKDNTIVNEYERIITYSLGAIEKKWYNKVTLSKLEKLLLILRFSDNQEKLKQLVKGDEYLMNLEKEYDFIKYLVEDLDKAFDYEQELKSRYEAIGEYKGKNEIALNLIKNNIPKNIILNSTNITEEEYQELIKK